MGELALEYVIRHPLEHADLLLHLFVSRPVFAVGPTPVLLLGHLRLVVLIQVIVYFHLLLRIV